MEQHRDEGPPDEWGVRPLTQWGTCWLEFQDTRGDPRLDLNPLRDGAPRFAVSSLVRLLLQAQRSATFSSICRNPRSLRDGSGVGIRRSLIGRLHATMTKTGNRLLVISADCAELREWRNGKRLDLDHMAQYQTIIEL